MGYEFNTDAKRSQIMKKIRGSDTQPEILFRKLLWTRGIRYRKNNKKLPGKPDISISKYKLAIFIDGEFWHGFDWVHKKDRIKSNRDYWIPKIEKNIERDILNNKRLHEMGWKVIRFWANEVKKTPDVCLTKVLSDIKGQKK